MWIFRFVYEEMSEGTLRFKEYRFDGMGRDDREVYVDAMQTAEE